MNIFTPDYFPPSHLKTKQIEIFPTDTSFFQSDFEAVMRNRKYLRIWSQSSWPEDDFTALKNREDLQQHVDDNKSHAAYGFMIYSPDRSVCYGSLYVNPLGGIGQNYVIGSEDLVQLERFQARIDCWIDSTLSAEMELKILAEIEKWLQNEWKIRAVFTARIGMDRRQDLYERMGLSLRARLLSRNSDSNLLLFF